MKLRSLCHDVWSTEIVFTLRFNTSTSNFDFSIRQDRAIGMDYKSMSAGLK
jgi:hypothetical protein